MPELPEVEITRRGIEPFVRGRRITGVIVRNPRLRHRVPRGLAQLLSGREVKGVFRRGKYLLFECTGGFLIVHLGMSGSLRLTDPQALPGNYDHLDIVFESKALRLRDPRRFGTVLWTGEAPWRHPLLAKLGVEPLGDKFSADYLHSISRNRRVSIKLLLMNSRIVAGIGNIYANESLFRAGIRPSTRSCRLARADCERLVEAVRETLLAALAAGGSTLRDFVHSDGSSGYFQQSYFVYDRASLPCRVCGKPILSVRLGQRSAFFCPKCQK